MMNMIVSGIFQLASKDTASILRLMKLTAATLLLLCCSLSFGANISFRGIAEGSHTYSPISGGSSGGGIGSFAVNPNQLTTNGGVLSIKDTPLFTNTTFYGNFVANGGAVFNSGIDLTAFSSNSVLVVDAATASLHAAQLSGLTFDGTTLTVTAGAQTPWSSDINGAGFSLTNAGDIIITNRLFIGPNRNAYISNALISSAGQLIFSISNAPAKNAIVMYGVLGGGAMAMSINTNDNTTGDQLQVNGQFTAGYNRAMRVSTLGVISLSTNLNTTGVTIISNDASSGTFSLQTSNSTASKIYQTTTGVGIGTATPATPLDVSGIVSATVYTNIAGDLRFNSAVNGNILLYSGTTLVGFVASSGIRSRTTFENAGGSAANPSYRFESDTDTGVWNPAANALGFATFGTNRLYIDTVGNVGINTTTPTAKLDITAATATATIATYQTNAPVTFATSGYTNTTGGNVFVSIIGTALTVTKFETNGTSLFGYGSITGTLPAIPLKPFQYITTSGTLTSNNVEPW